MPDPSRVQYPSMSRRACWCTATVLSALSTDSRSVTLTYAPFLHVKNLNGFSWRYDVMIWKYNIMLYFLRAWIGMGLSPQVLDCDCIMTCLFSFSNTPHQKMSDDILVVLFVSSQPQNHWLQQVDQGHHGCFKPYCQKQSLRL